MKCLSLMFLKSLGDPSASQKGDNREPIEAPRHHAQEGFAYGAGRWSAIASGDAEFTVEMRGVMRMVQDNGSE